MGISAAAIRAGKAIVVLATDNEALERGLKQGEALLNGYAKSADQIGKTLQRAGAAGVAAFSAMLALGTQAAANTGKIAERIGTSVEALSGLEYVARRTGADLDTLNEGLTEMVQRLGEAATTGTGSAADELKLLGLSAKELLTLKPEDALGRIADAINQLPTAGDRAFAIDEIFGGDGRKMMELLRLGSAGMAELRDEAQRLGLVISGSDAKAAAEFNQQLGDLKALAIQAAVTIGGALAPVAIDLLNALKENAAAAAQWIAQHKGAITTAAKLAAVLLTVGSALRVTATAAKALAVVSGLLAANPLTLALAGAAAALAVVAVAVGNAAGAFDDATVAADRFAASQRQVREEGDKLRAQHQEQFERLQALQKQESLTADEHAEAKKIVDELTRAYHGLGVSIDETTGKLRIETDAQKELTEQQLASLVNQRQLELSGIRSQKRAAKAELDEFDFSGFGFGTPSAARLERDHQLHLKILDLRRQEEEIESHITALREKRAGVVNDELRTKPTPAELAEADAAAVEAPAVEKLTPHQAAFEAAERAAAEQRAALLEQEAEAAFQDSQRINARNAELARRLQELEVAAANPEGNARDLALFDLRQQFAREDADREGLNLDLFGDIQARDRAAFVADQLKNSGPALGGSGGYSGALLARQFGGGTEEKQLDELKKLRDQQANEARRLERAVKKAAPKFQ